MAALQTLLSTNQLSPTCQTNLLNIISQNIIGSNSINSLISVLVNGNLSLSSQASLINFISDTNLPPSSASSLIQILATNNLDPLASTSLINVLVQQPSLPIISQSSLINLLAPNQIDPATQMQLLSLLADPNLDTLSQATLIDTLSARNLPASSQTSVVNAIYSANFSSSSLPTILSILSNVILSTNNVLQIKSLFSNTNVTYIEYVLTLISHTLTNDLISGQNASSLAGLLTQNANLISSGCLSNCSNNGDCQLDASNGTYSCFCARNYAGNACQFIYNPCLAPTLPCLNQGTCVLKPNYENPAVFDFDCVCTSFYNGSSCENLISVCWNVTCSSRGVCVDDGSHRAVCKCIQYYSGSDCEIVEPMKKTVETTQLTATIIAASFLFLLGAAIVLNDVFNIFGRTPKTKPSLKGPFLDVKRFYYKP